MVACIHPGPVLPLLPPFVSAASGSSGAAAPPPAAHPPGGGRAGRGCGGAEGSGSPPAGCVRERGGRCAPPAGREGRVLLPPRCSAAASLALEEGAREGGELGAGEAESKARRRCLCPCPRRAPGPAAPLSARRSPGWPSGHTAAALVPAPPPSSRPPPGFLTAGARPGSRQGCTLARGRATRGRRVRVCCGAGWGAGKPRAPSAAGAPSGVSRAGPSCSPLALSQRCHRSTLPSSESTLQHFLHTRLKSR